MLTSFLRLKLLWSVRRYIAGVARLFFDRRVSLPLKSLTVLAAVLVVSPIDLLSDIPVVGALDDMALLALIAALFVKFCPNDAVADYLGIRRAATIKNVTPR